MKRSKDLVIISADDNLETFPGEPHADDSAESGLFKVVLHQPSSKSSRLSSRSMSLGRWVTISRRLTAAASAAGARLARALRGSTRSVAGLILNGAALSFVVSIALYSAALRNPPPAPVSQAKASTVPTRLEPFTYPAAEDLPARAAPAVLREEIAPATPAGWAGKPDAAAALRSSSRNLPEPAAAPAPPEDAPDLLTRAVDTNAVDTVVRRYRMAFNALDASALESVWPSADTRALRRTFSQISSQELVFDQCATEIKSQSAVVTCSGRATWAPRNSARRVEARRWTFALQKEALGWVIRRVDSRPAK